MFTLNGEPVAVNPESVSSVHPTPPGYAAGTMIDVQNGSEIVKEPFAEVVKKLNENRVAWSRRLSPGSASGPCFAVPHSPWSRPFAPRAPPPPRPLCSPASLLLRAGPTSPSRSSSATASGLPDAVPATAGGDSDGDLPVPRWKASAHCQGLRRRGATRTISPSV
jgi:hypothetical protein